jgi:hypothetical protein
MAPSTDFVVEHAFKSWKEYKSGVMDFLADSQKGAEYRKNNSNLLENFIFRSQADPDWKLVSAFDRIFDRPGVTAPREMYERFIKEFVELCVTLQIIKEPEAQFDDAGKLKNAIRFEALGRHFGLFTRLLDWSKSPYVAAFFGCADRFVSTGKSNIAVWCLDVNAVRFAFEDHDLLIFERNYPDNERQFSQGGVFSKNNSNLAALDDLVQRKNSRFRADPGCPILMKFLIPTSERDASLKDLNMMKINNIELFRGIAGVSMYMNEKIIAAGP